MSRGLPWFSPLVFLLAFEAAVPSGVYDITTIYKFQRASTGNTTLESGEIIARGNARGTPLRRGATILNVDSDARCCTEWENDGWRKLSTADAQDAVPILDPSLRENPQARGLRQTGHGWQGTLEPGQTIRVDFTPSSPTSPSSQVGGGYLAALLCDTPFPRSCYGVSLTGHRDGRLRYYWMRYSSDGKQGPFWVPGGGQVTLRASVDTKDESIREGWLPVRRYTFQLERTPASQVHVHLEDGDAAQEQQRVFDLPGSNYKYLFIDRYKKEGELRVQSDPAWQGRVDAGRELPLTWSPAEGKGSRLGVFLCTSARADECHGAEVSGSDGKGLRVDWAKYGRGEQSAAWAPGHDKYTRRTVLGARDSVPEGWAGRQYNLTLRQQGWRTTLSLDGGQTETWEVPAGHNYVIVASYKSKGLVEIRADAGKLSTQPIMWPVWALDYGRTEASFTSPPIKAPPQHQLCVVLGAKVPADGRLQLGFKGVGPGYRQVTPIINLTPGDSPEEGWTHRRTVVSLPLELVRRSDRIQLVLNATTVTDENILVQIADVCNALGDRDITTFVSDAAPLRELHGFDVASSAATKPFAGKPGKASPCRHGGVLDLVAARCRCPPGFQGKTCEIGCGNNLIGSECDTRCSDNTREGCEGLLVCGPGMPCSCAPGFRGQACDRVCSETKYGPNCQFTCGRCFEGAPCDPYTGVCLNGCSSGFQPPLCNQSCGTTGKEREPLIHRGTPVNITSFPWHAGLYKKVGSKYLLQCGGSLIADNLILTAAHCVSDLNAGEQYSADDFMVALGKTVSDWDAPEDTDVVKRQVYEIIVEPFYRGGSAAYTNDIAVLVLERAAPFSQYVTPVCVNWRRDSELDLRPGTAGQVAGWGENENSTVSDSLFSLAVSILERDDCVSNVTQKLRQFFTKDKICAGHLGALDGALRRVAKGDSGGGLCFRDSRGTWYIRGVVSLGLTQHPTFATYTDVNFYRDFLNDVRDKVVIEEVRLRELLEGRRRR